MRAMLESSRGTPRSCSVVRSATGKVTFEELVENAVTMTLRMRRKKRTGDILPL